MQEKVERRIQFKDKISNIPQLALKRISAVTPELIKTMNLEMDANCQSQTPGKIGCILSHLKAIHTAYHEGRPYAIIAEDDLVILELPNFYDIVNTAPPDWNIIQLLVSGNEKAFKNYELYYNHSTPFVRYEPDYYGAVIYLINRKGMETILRKFLPKDDLKAPWNAANIDLRQVIGICLSDFVLYSSVKTYQYTRPYFTFEIKNDSSIHTDHFYYHKLAADRLVNYYKMAKGLK